MIQFNINVPSGVYAKYYFDLRTLADKNEFVFPVEALDKNRAAKLEVPFHSTLFFLCSHFMVEPLVLFPYAPIRNYSFSVN